MVVNDIDNDCDSSTMSFVHEVAKPVGSAEFIFDRKDISRIVSSRNIASELT
jgi:hypothetical protein